MSDIDPIDVAALRRLLFEGARLVEDEEDVEEMTPVERADVVVDHLETLHHRVAEFQEIVDSPSTARLRPSSKSVAGTLNSAMTLISRAHPWFVTRLQNARAWYTMDRSNCGVALDAVSGPEVQFSAATVVGVPRRRPSRPASHRQGQASAQRFATGRARRRSGRSTRGA